MVFIIYVGCQIYGFNVSVAALAEIWSLAAVSYDRLIAIYHPLQTGKRITKSRVSYRSILLSSLLRSIYYLLMRLQGMIKKVKFFQLLF